MEAAFICPMCIVSIVLVWYLGFFYHNKLVCQSICREAVYVGLEAERCGKDVEAAVMKVLDEQSRMLFNIETVEKDVYVTDTQICAKVKVVMEFPIPLLPGDAEENVWFIQEECSVEIRNPARVIRYLRSLEKIIDGSTK